MTYAALQDINDGDWETYEKIVARWSATPTPPIGLIMHVAGDVDGRDAHHRRVGNGGGLRGVRRRSNAAGSASVLAGHEMAAAAAPQVVQVKHVLRPDYSHSMVPGGFDVMSKATRLTPGTSLMMRLERRSSRS